MKLDQTKENGVFSVAMKGNLESNNNSVKYITANAYPDHIGASYNSLATDTVRHALYSWYVDHDLASAKQWFYLAARLIAESTTKPKGATLWTCHDFMFPLLSDSPEMIALFATLSPPGVDNKPSFADKRENPREGEFQSYLVQTAIKGDDQKLDELVALFKAKSLKKNAKFNNAYIQFYTGLIGGDVPEMEAALDYLGKLQSQNPTTEDFLAFHAVIMCKLAWLRGYEVQVDSPLVPMAFMPVAPLPHYDDVYEFLKPGWQAPPPPEPEKKGFFAKLFGK
jgi:hypothetical protein